MFGILKKKFSSVIESLAKKKEQVDEQIEKLEEKVEKEPEKAVEEIKETFGERPEIKDIERELKQEAKSEKKVSLFKRAIKKLTEKKLTEEDVEPILNELENDLIEADVAFEVAEKIKNDLKKSLLDLELKRSEIKDVVVSRLKNSLMDILNVPKIDLEKIVKKTKSENRPLILLFLGFNGSGKTTTLAKVAKWLMDRGYTCCFAAGDSWRKAAIEQLEEHGNMLKVPVIKHQYGSDPAAIIYDGVEHSKTKGINVLLADSAGRTHTNKDLIDELKKIIRVNKPDLKILVMDSLVGSDAVPQCQMFNDAVGIDGVIFTKNDVNPKGGAILSVSYLIKKPILFLGVGQNHSDLIEFDRVKFVDELLSG